MLPRLGKLRVVFFLVVLAAVALPSSIQAHVAVQQVDEEATLELLPERLVFGSDGPISPVGGPQPPMGEVVSEEDFTRDVEGFAPLTAAEQELFSMSSPASYGWRAWRRPSGTTHDTPAVATRSGDLHMAIQGTNGGVYYGHMTPDNRWHGWQRLSGSTASPPALTVNPHNGNLYMLIRGTNNGIYYAGKPAGGRWTSWQRLPGATSSAPSMVYARGALHAVIRGTNNRIYYSTRRIGGRWSSWQRLSGLTVEKPALTANPNGNLYMVIRGANNGIYYAGKPHGGDWSGWQRLPGATTAAPSVVYSNGAVHATVQGQNRGIYYNKRPVGGNWTNWQRLPGATVAAPRIAATDLGLHILIQGGNNGIYYNCNPLWSDWIGWVRLAGTTSTAPTAVGAGGHLYVAVRSWDSGIWFRVREYNAHSDDPYFTHQWGLHNIGQYGGYVDADIDAPEAWGISQGRRGVMIAVVDTGTDYGHEDLRGDRMRTDIDYDFINWDDDAADDHGHGTHVSGIAAANTHNYRGIAGVCPNCEILPVKVLDYDGSGTEASVSNGIVYAADQGAHIVNLSLGAQGCSNLIADAVNYAYEERTTIVAAAGNGEDCAATTAVLGDSGNIVTPANLNRVIAVGASNNRDEKAEFSSYGPELDVMAPGVKIESTVLDDQYEFHDGTSMASPFAAGTLGLVLSAKPGLSNETLRHLLRVTADDICAPGRENYCGWGRINAWRALSATPTPRPDLPPDSCEQHQSLGVDGLRVLYYGRRVRDELLVGSAKGREYTELYYQHSPEVSRMLLQNGELRRHMASFLLKYLPDFKSVLPGSAEQARITAEIIEDATQLKNNIYQEAGPELRQDIARVWKEIDLASREGETVPEVWKQLASKQSAGAVEGQTDWTTASDMFVENELIIKLTPEAARMSTWMDGSVTSAIASIDALGERYGIEAVRLVFPETADDASRVKQYGLDRIFKVVLNKQADLLTVLEAFKGIPEIEYVEPNKVFRIDAR